MTTEMSKLYEDVGFSLDHVEQTEYLNMEAVKDVYSVLKDGKWHPIKEVKDTLKQYGAGLMSVAEALLIAEDSKGKYLCIDKGEGITPEYSPYEQRMRKEYLQKIF